MEGSRCTHDFLRVLTDQNIKREESPWYSGDGFPWRPADGLRRPASGKPKQTGPLANPAMAEQRIKDTLANPRFTQAQKDQIIATIKQRNHMQ